jgi:Gpi18-like mannosyltransferase
MRMRSWRDLALLTFAGLLLRLFFLPSPGHMLDLQTFGQWALAAADNPWNRAYEATNMNYPPGALLIFEGIGRSYRALVTNDPNHALLRLAVKLPSVLFDCIGGIVIYGIARRFAAHRRALLAAALFLFNPAIVYDSSIWGMNDTITSVSALAAVWCLLAGKRMAAWTLLAFAALNKPPVIVLAPLFILETFITTEYKQRKGWEIAVYAGILAAAAAIVLPWNDPGMAIGAGLSALLLIGWIVARRFYAGHRFFTVYERITDIYAGVLAAFVVGLLTAYPFYTDHHFFAVYHRMFAWYVVGSSLYPFTSANAFNVHALYGDFFRPDTIPILFVPLKYWADLAFIGVAGCIYMRYTRLRDDRALLEACFLTLLAFFLLLTEMHERYLIYALTFVPALAVLDIAYLWSTIALTIAEWLNLEYSLTYMWLNFDNPQGVNPKEFAPVLVHLCALTNIAAFIVGMRLYIQREKPDVGR